MISLNTINQINDIMTILNNTKAKLNGTKGSNFAQAIQQATVQTPAQTVQQIIVKPDATSKPVVIKKCKYCGKDVTGDMPFCDENHASMYRTYGPRRQ